MKKLSISLLALAAALIAAPAAHADQTPGWYVGAGVGATLPPDADLREPRTGVHGAREEDVNVDALGDVGYAWTNGLRLEGEYFHNQNNVNKVGGYTNAGGHISNNAAFANAFYDFKTGTIYTPYVGGGAGVDFVNVKSVGASGAGFLIGDTTKFAYQGIAGVSAQLDPSWSVSIDYRYVASLDPKVDSTTGGQGRIDNASHNVIAGLRYSFGVPAAAVAETPARAPSVAPHAAAKPAVAPMAPNFTVFFDFNKSVLTPEAKNIIAAAAKEYKKSGSVTINVTGHTDTVGSVKYNDKLSEQRALAVEAELKKLGVETSHIKAAGVGKEGLLVPTADGVREAQNRRAEIVLSK